MLAEADEGTGAALRGLWEESGLSEILPLEHIESMLEEMKSDDEE